MYQLTKLTQYMPFLNKYHIYWPHWMLLHVHETPMCEFALCGWLLSLYSLALWPLSVKVHQLGRGKSNGIRSILAPFIPVPAPFGSLLCCLAVYGLLFGLVDGRCLSTNRLVNVYWFFSIVPNFDKSHDEAFCLNHSLTPSIPGTRSSYSTGWLLCGLFVGWRAS